MAVRPFVIAKALQRRGIQPVKDIDYVLTDRLIRTQTAAILGVTGEQCKIQVMAVH
jgi:hypothetical protein